MPKASKTATKKTRLPATATEETTQAEDAPALAVRVGGYYEIETENDRKVYGQLVDHNEAEGVQTLKMWVGGEASFTQDLQNFKFADHNVLEIDRQGIQEKS